MKIEFNRHTKLITFGIGVVILFYTLFFNYLGATEVGITRDLLTGKVNLQHAGMHLSLPWVLVSTIDTRPQRVCVESASRSFNCKLVQFKPEFYKEFVHNEGFYYYWLYNRISFNLGYESEYRGVKDILRGYAFSADRKQFVEITEEY